jgi:8-oxo-dGTP pyrophosphatase MutT (NUDIX family)
MPHIHEKIDFTVDIFIVYKNRVLIRKHDKYHKWLAVGGHIELDETPIQAALREVQEEVGLKIVLIPPRKMPQHKNHSEITELISPWYCNIHKINETHKHISLVYFAMSKSDIVVPEYADDISNEWKWFTKNELKKNNHGMSESIIFYATEALKELGKK